MTSSSARAKLVTRTRDAKATEDVSVERRMTVVSCSRARIAR
jgi:hypothetical protein